MTLTTDAISNWHNRRRESIGSKNDPVAGSCILSDRIFGNPHYLPMARERTESEVIRQARTMAYDEDQEFSLMSALETISLNGFADEESGDSESPTGYFYRIDRWIVVIDSAGFSYLTPWTTEAEAKKDFEQMEHEYSLYLSSDEDLSL